MSSDKNVMLTRDSENRASADFRSIDKLLESVFGETPVFSTNDTPYVSLP